MFPQSVPGFSGKVPVPGIEADCFRRVSFASGPMKDLFEKLKKNIFFLVFSLNRDYVTSLRKEY